MGRTYGYGAIYDTGKFRGKRAMLSLTTGGPEESYLKDGFNGDLAAILRPIHRGIRQFLGFDVLTPRVISARSVPTRKCASNGFPNMLTASVGHRGWWRVERIR